MTNTCVVAVTADHETVRARVKEALDRVAAAPDAPSILPIQASEARLKLPSKIGIEASLLVVLGPGVEGAAELARAIDVSHPSTYFVFVVERDRVSAVQHALLHGAPPGGRWAVHIYEDDGLESRIHDALKALAQQKRFRASVSRISTPLAEHTTVQEPEYRRLVASDHYLANVLRHAHDAIISVGRRGEVLSWNQAAELMLDKTAADAIGNTFREHFSEPALIDEFLRLAEQGDYVRRDLQCIKDGEERYFDAVFARVDHQAGSVVGIAVIMREVTQQRLLEKQAKAAERRKDEFLAMLAHELRNPLAPIRNTADFLTRLYSHDPRISDAGRMIARQANHLTALLSDLMDVSRITRGFGDLNKTVVAPEVFVTRAIEQVQNVIDRKQQVLSVIVAPDVGDVCGDADRLTQVVANILDNAAKYSAEYSTIDIAVGADEHAVHIRINDSGEGIDKGLMPHIFELFTQGERTLDRANGGLGIGLAIVKTLVEMHDGTVTASSDPIRGGSCFTISLPRYVAETAAVALAADPPTPTTPRQAILIVDDNDDAATSLRMLVELEGHDVSVARSGEEALMLVRQRHFTVFILDIGMPGMDGFVLARKLRKLRQTRNALLIAHTGYGQPEDIAYARAVGFDHHLTKPSDLNDLLSLLSSRRS